MSRRSHMRFAGTSTLLGLMWALTSSPAVAAAPTSCVFDDQNSSATVTVGDGLVATVSRNGDAIEVDGIPCETATVHNTDVIDVSTPAVSAETVAVDLSGGPLSPGGTDEGDGSSEIEFEVQLGGAAIGSLDQVHVIGGVGSDVLSADGYSANMNAEEAVPDDDLTVFGEGELELLGGEGNDEILLSGFGGEGIEIPKTARGGPGEDRLLGDLNGSVIDGGPGRDIADYSGADFGLSLGWDATASFIFGAPGLDHLRHLEVAILSDEHDTVVYQGAATGETWLGKGADIAIAGRVTGGDPADRLVRGGPGTLDFLTFPSSPTDPATVELTANTVDGSWAATYLGFEYVEAGSGDDRFRVTKRGSYPGLLGRDGEDVVDLRAASQGISVTLGQPTFGTRKWLTAFEIERVLGSDFNDVLLGPAGWSVNDPKEIVGFSGRDVLSGGAGPDRLAGGAGRDILRGNGGADTLKASLGDDSLEGGPGLDALFGGPGNDALFGGSGVDHCDGGPGINSFAGC